MKKKLTIDDVTQEVKSYVTAYLMQRAYAETMREKVNEIHNAILTEIPIYADLFGHDEQITKSENLYLASNYSACQTFYTESDLRLKKAGLKPQDMERDICPALTEESKQRDIERLLIEAGARMVGVDKPEDWNHVLLCNGLDKRQKFIDLLVGLIVNLPGYKNPLTGQKLAA